MYKPKCGCRDKTYVSRSFDLIPHRSLRLLSKVRSTALKDEKIVKRNRNILEKDGKILDQLRFIFGGVLGMDSPYKVLNRK
jgi:hypothetical protein